MKMENLIKVIISAVSTFISAVVGGIGIALTVLLGLMLIDFITGMIASYYNGKKIRSDIGVRGALKKVYILLLIGSVYMVQNLADFELAGYTGDGLAIMFAVFELISIIENGIAMGIKFPTKFAELFSNKKHGV